MNAFYLDKTKQCAICRHCIAFINTFPVKKKKKKCWYAQIQRNNYMYNENRNQTHYLIMHSRLIAPSSAQVKETQAKKYTVH